MPYFVLRDSLAVVVTPPSGAPPANADVIDGETVAVCAGALIHGQQLTASQAELLLSGNATAYLDTLDGTPGRDALTPAVDTSPSLPPTGRWEYRVLPMTEFLGLGTAKGTAARMEEELNRLAQDGWELVTTSERDSRWIGGETVLMTLRRYVVSERLFAERFRAEELLRRQVLQELDDAPAGEAVTGLLG